MPTNRNSYNRIISALKNFQAESGLHPLAKAQIRLAVLERIKTAPAGSPVRSYSYERSHPLMRYAITILAGLSVLGGTAFAAGNAKPGDLLFPVKKATEQLQIKLADSEQTKTSLQIKFAQERANELAQVETKTHASTTPAALHAEAAAKAEVSGAINELRHVQADLEAKGNAIAAAAVTQTITRLQGRLNDSGQNNRDRSRGKNDGNGGEDNGSGSNIIQATTTTSTIFRLNSLKHDEQNDHSGKDRQPFLNGFLPASGTPSAITASSGAETELHSGGRHGADDKNGSEKRD